MLQDNFLYACIKYAEQHGGITTSYLRFSPDIVGLVYDNNNFSIAYWNHPSRPPTNNELSLFSEEDLVPIKAWMEKERSFLISRFMISDVQEFRNTVLDSMAVAGDLLMLSKSLYVFDSTNWIPICHTDEHMCVCSDDDSTEDSDVCSSGIK
jgi:hypothetical protein